MGAEYDGISSCDHHFNRESHDFCATFGCGFECGGGNNICTAAHNEAPARSLSTTKKSHFSIIPSSIVTRGSRREVHEQPACESNHQETPCEAAAVHRKPAPPPVRTLADADASFGSLQQVTQHHWSGSIEPYTPSSATSFLPPTFDTGVHSVLADASPDILHDLRHHLSQEESGEILMSLSETSPLEGTPLPEGFGLATAEDVDFMGLGID